MKIAYCIICHKFSKVLEKTVDILCENNDIFVHVDKKSNLKDFEKIKNKVFLIENREDVKWGNYSLIKATLNLLKETQDNKYDYIVLLSGDCLPLKSDYEIKEFFTKHKGEEFIGVISKGNYEERVERNYCSWHFKKNKNFLEKIISKIQRKANIYTKNKNYRFLPKIYKGPNWFIITSNFRDYIFKYLQENPNYEKAFLHSFCGDEIFFQTIACNSEFKNKIYGYKTEVNDNFMCLRYIDWQSGPEFPKILTEDDFSKILETNCLFGRKFDENLNLEVYEKTFLLKK